MSPSATHKRGRAYRYYVCLAAQKRGRSVCPSKSVAAGALERFVLERIQAVGRDPALLARVLAETQAVEAEQIASREAEVTAAVNAVRSAHAEVRRLSERFQPGESNCELVSQLAAAHEQVTAADAVLTEARHRRDTAGPEPLSESDTAAVLAAFQPIWDVLTPREQSRTLRLLVSQVEYDGRTRRATVSFHPTGLRTFLTPAPHSPMEEMSP